MTLWDGVMPSPRGYWPEALVDLGEWSRPGGRCHLCGRFLSDVTVLLVADWLSDQGAPAAVVGQCKVHGPVEADYDLIWWGDE